MMLCGLLGEKLTHSYSPQIHKQLGDYAYELFEVTPNRLQSFLENTNFHGINVTIPYKKAVIPYCSSLSEQAKLVGAVNTILRTHDGKLIGHNSDYFGFSSMVRRMGLCLEGKKVLILGSGGASATVNAVLKSMNANAVVISRKGPDHYGNLDKHADCAVIVNTTPVGMYPNNGYSPIDLSLFPKLEAVMDLIYNPANTRLLQDAQARGIKTENGLWMLIAQAKESAEWFLNKKIPDTTLEDIYQNIRFGMQNIILIGMPGCGKSTVGQALSKKLNRPFFDTDIYIKQSTGYSCAEYIENHGEAMFRKAETEALCACCMRSGAVIATGGGCVTIPENYDILHQNGIVIRIDRSLEKLDTADRPLSQTHGLEALYHKRKPLYEHFSDITVHNDCSVEETVKSILEQLNTGGAV